MSLLKDRTDCFTLEDFNAIPEGPPYYEYEEGRILLVASTTIDHEDILDALTIRVKPFVVQNKLGRMFRAVDVYLPDGRVFIPDMGFLSSAKLNCVSPTDRKIHGAPTLVIEVVSSDSARDRVHKFKVYFENGVEWYWLITQELAIEEYQATPQGYVRTASIEAGEAFRPGVFPGLGNQFKNAARHRGRNGKQRKQCRQQERCKC